VRQGTRLLLTSAQTIFAARALQIHKVSPWTTSRSGVAARNSLATQSILAKRIIEMADQGLRDIPALRDDALAFLQHSPPSASRNGLGEAIGARAAPLAELSRAGSVGETPQPAASAVHSMAGMGQSRLGATSNNNPLAVLHSGLEQAHEARGGP
jgi:hypothetical protein